MIQSAEKKRGVKLGLSRRQVILGAAAATGVQLLPLRRAGAIHVRFPKGAPVPPWLEMSTKPASFGTPVEVAEEYISDPDRVAFAGMGYRDVPETRLNVRATTLLGVGDCLIRYEGGTATDCRVLLAARQPYKGRIWWSRNSQPPGTWMWTEDGPDMLLYARVAEPQFRIVTSRLAERVALSAIN